MIVPQDVAAIPWRSPWVPAASPQFEARLAKEVGPGHVLSGRPVIAIGRRLDTDDVMFYLPNGPTMLAVVHLTYSLGHRSRTLDFPTPICTTQSVSGSSNA